MWIIPSRNSLANVRILKSSWTGALSRKSFEGEGNTLNGGRDSSKYSCSPIERKWLRKMENCSL
ncbi:hypothetical protein PR202_gb15551 [Eleusine coracana subsp. coracana]|uniref:Uncharacterized protein n=1 Tax=Eleusine coracana subsp. coracana TaxID=191504 RepID=A0AAV5EY64_ELECO|nr:hypothetical protein PR202_gb15551 [Eleusine coracana subsp. coracana]